MRDVDKPFVIVELKVVSVSIVVPEDLRERSGPNHPEAKGREPLDTVRPCDHEASVLLRDSPH